MDWLRGSGLSSCAVVGAPLSTTREQMTTATRVPRLRRDGLADDIVASDGRSPGRRRSSSRLDRERPSIPPSVDTLSDGV